MSSPLCIILISVILPFQKYCNHKGPDCGNGHNFVHFVFDAASHFGHCSQSTRTMNAQVPNPAAHIRIIDENKKGALSNKSGQ